MDMCSFLTGVFAGLAIAGLVVGGRFCALLGIRDEQRELSSTIPSISESSSRLFVTDYETGKAFSFVRSRANRLGAGRYGEVFRGTCLQTQTPVAIKLICRRQYGDGEQALKYFKREIDTLKVGNLVSENVVQLLSSVADHERFAIVTEFCEQGEMSRWLDDALSNGDGYQEQLATVLEAYVQLANGLLALHKQRILHRDLKGTNVFITLKATNFVRGSLVQVYGAGDQSWKIECRPNEPFTVKIGDFGLARFLLDADELTVGVGTNGFMAPEIRSGTAYEEQSDLYSLGVMLTRDLARVGIDIEKSYHCAHLNRVVTSLTNTHPQERATLDSLLTAMMNFMVTW